VVPSFSGFEDLSQTLLPDALPNAAAQPTLQALRHTPALTQNVFSPSAGENQREGETQAKASKHLTHTVSRWKRPLPARRLVADLPPHPTLLPRG